MLHATLREAAVAALECDAVWGPENEDNNADGDGGGGDGGGDGGSGGASSVAAVLRELAAHVVSVTPSKTPHMLRQNIALAMRLTRRLLDTSVAAAAAAATRVSPVDQAGLDAAAAAALQPMLEVGRYRLSVSKYVLKARLVSALETKT